ncbi:hypothetical protein REPUB_Repub16aG0049500 [Reevesia pubescens]
MLYGPVENVGDYHHMWKLLWKLKTLPNIRIYMWRLVMNILPTLDNLQSRGIIVDNICRVCDEEVDSWKHFCFECIYSKRVYAILTGLELAQQWSFDHIILESDCLIAMNEVNGKGQSMMDSGCIIEDIKDAFTCCTSCSIRFVRRDANVSVAAEVAALQNLD